MGAGSTFAGGRLELICGDIVNQDVDVVVNAANTTLLGGGGVDGAIHRAAGPELLGECRELKGCPTGEARLTRGYCLLARHVIHTVGPIYRGGNSDEPALLRSCYRSSLRLAAENHLRTIAFPSISTGVYGYPIQAAAQIALASCAEWLTENDLPEKLTFVLFGKEDLSEYRSVAETIWK